jgi:phosphoglycolate phosphatase
LCSFIGPPLPATFEKELGFSGEKVDEAVAKYREHFSTKGLYENKVYEGIPELLEKLKSHGYELIVATSKPEPFAKEILEHFDLAKYFTHICGSNLDETRGKEEEVIEYALELSTNKDKSTILMIGDREYDVYGAKINKIKSAGVLYGYGNKEEFEKAKADYIFQTVKDLQDFLTKDLQ